MRALLSQIADQCGRFLKALASQTFVVQRFPNKHYRNELQEYLVQGGTGIHIR
jgi:hypothetical protein